MFTRLRSLAAASALVVSCLAGCGEAADHQPTAGHSGKIGREGGQHALGADPNAELKRIQHGGTRAASPGTLPGR
jgi:hypothetical protein